MMSTGQTRIAEARNKPKPARPLEQKPALQREQLPVQAKVPQVAYRRAQTNRNGLTAADLLVLQRTVGNRGVQRMLARRADSGTSRVELVSLLQRQTVPASRGPVIIHQAAFKKALRPTRSGRPCWKRYKSASW